MATALRFLGYVATSRDAFLLMEAYLSDHLTPVNVRSGDSLSGHVDVHTVHLANT